MRQRVVLAILTALIPTAMVHQALSSGWAEISVAAGTALVFVLTAGTAFTVATLLDRSRSSSATPSPTKQALPVDQDLSLLLKDEHLTLRLITKQLPVAKDAERIRVTLPLALITPHLSSLLRSLPRSIPIQLAITGLWPAYTNDQTWHNLLSRFTGNLTKYFGDDISLLSTRWQSPLIVLETDDETIRLLIPLERDTNYYLYLDTSQIPSIKDSHRNMNALIFNRARPLDISDLSGEVEA